MKERPILFSAPMVRAILDGRKTQTRRVVRPQPSTVVEGEPYWNVGGWRAWKYRNGVDLLRKGGADLPSRCGQPGDRLWVRETWAATDRALKKRDQASVNYRATGEIGPYLKWRPSIYMPRWASRITLDVTDVRVERLIEISDADAKAEGVDTYESISPEQHVPGVGFNRARMGDQPHRLPFADLWRSLNGPESWDANPWVWVISFKRVTP